MCLERRVGGNGLMQINNYHCRNEKANKYEQSLKKNLCYIFWNYLVHKD
ncbi:hypothetical protein [Segetibacter koreensis]|nr:hypothetical protein [Segetibacter koreensis]